MGAGELHGMDLRNRVWVAQAHAMGSPVPYAALSRKERAISRCEDVTATSTDRLPCFVCSLTSSKHCSDLDLDSFTYTRPEEINIFRSDALTNKTKSERPDRPAKSGRTQSLDTPINQASTKKSIIFTASTPPQAPKKTFRDLDRVELYEMDSGRIINAANKLDIRTPARCQLLELPTELRLLIYDFVYDTDYKPAVHIYENWSMTGRLTYQGPTGDARPCLSGLPHTCKAIYKEALPVVYRTQSFHVQVLWSWSANTSVPTTVFRSCAFVQYIENMDITVTAYSAGAVTSAATRLVSFLAAFDGTINGDIRLHLGTYPAPGRGDRLYQALMTTRIGERAMLYHVLGMYDVLQDPEPLSASKSVWQEFKKGFKGKSVAMRFAGRY
ncbi:hypothetical protein LTR49_014405 [Elasticomyces elasticus]|nr:hypothetical protein LTR49_014405 [Elasticomyces elasticus]KAK5766289.1 hypothetical protein LTS12_003500 [Elasticomyces elasticus]